MATIPSTASTLPAEIQRYYDRLFLERLQNFRKYNFLAVQKSFPKNSGQIVYFTRVAQLTANTTALTDGVTPTGINSTSSNVIATAKPYGAWEQIASLYEMTTIDEGLKEHVEIMAQNAGESINKSVDLKSLLNILGTLKCLTTNVICRIIEMQIIIKSTLWQSEASLV